MTTGERVIKWGRPPLALVPEALAGRLAAVPLPGWLTVALDTPGATVAALTADAWDHLPTDEQLRRQVRDHILAIFLRYGYGLGDVVVATLPGGLAEPPGPVLWRTRARDALLAAVGPDPAQRYPLTFGELLAVPKVGLRTALEATALLELGGTARGEKAAEWSMAGRLPARPGPRRRRATPGSSGGGGGRDEDGGRGRGRDEDGGRGGGNRSARGGTRGGGHRPPGGPPPAVTIVRWGEPGGALLPRSLRLAFATTPLPPPLARELCLPPGTTAEALDQSVWERAGGLSPWNEKALLDLVTSRAVRPLRILDGEWPEGLDPQDVPWPTRLRNALTGTGYLQPAVLAGLTYDGLLALSGIGWKSALELGVVADSLCPAPEGPVGGEARAAFLQAALEDWTVRVHAGDRRFAGALPPCEGTLRQMLLHAYDHPDGPLAQAMPEALSRVRARAAELAAEPIDRGLLRLADALGLSRRDMVLAAGRLGWNGGPRQTLQGLAERHGVSRERVRQLVDRTVARLGRPFVPQVERAVALLADEAPIAGARAGELLAEKGLAGEPMDPAALLSLARALDYDVPFRVDDCGGAALLVVAGSGTTSRTLAAARARARLGVGAVEEVRQAAGRSGRAWSLEDVEVLLATSAEFELLGNGWYWSPGTGSARNPLRNATRRMLAVTPSLDLATVHRGLARVQRAGPALASVPEQVLAAYFDRNPEYVRRGRVVEAVRPIDERRELRQGERAIVDVLRAAPGRVLSRAELGAAVAARGVGSAHFNSLTTHSPILDHVARDRWCLRGDQPGDRPGPAPTARS